MAKDILGPTRLLRGHPLAYLLRGLPVCFVIILGCPIRLAPLGHHQELVSKEAGDRHLERFAQRDALALRKRTESRGHTHG